MERKKEVIEKLNLLNAEGVKKSQIEKDLGMPKNNLSGFIHGKRELSEKWFDKIMGYDPLGQQKEDWEKKLEELLFKAPNLKETKKKVFEQLVHFGQVRFAAITENSFDGEPITKFIVDEFGQWPADNPFKATETPQNPADPKNKADTPKDKETPVLLPKNESDEVPKHKLWKKGDPAENTNSFFLRYGAFTYDQIEKQ